MVRISSAAASHPGLRREQNEDAYCVRPDLGLYLVADGMGGHAAGEVASHTVVDAVEAFVNASAGAGADFDWPLPFETDLSVDANRLHMALVLANRRLGAAMERDPSLRGMATTAAAVLATGDRAVVAHVGDSRVYSWRGGTLTQVTADHSWVGEQIRAGFLSELDARHHPWRNVVTRALTGNGDPKIDLAELEPHPGDRVLLCSDGLSGVVSDETLQSAMAADEPPADRCQRLVEAALRAGGPDNITVAVLDFDVA